MWQIVAGNKMKNGRKSLEAIPTHVFMGFLGAGKTSAILSLFEKKPANERWAVLVNEYGKLGIDGAHYQSQGVYVKEIPGGCMCCASGVPMQVAVNQLLRKSRPDRLFVETSGLGHPEGVLKTLRSEYFKKVLRLQASICLIDPEKLLAPEMQSNVLFWQQVSLADILVANKVDLASEQALASFDALEGKCLIPKLVVAKTTFGSINPAWLKLLPTQGRESDAIACVDDGANEAHAFIVVSQEFPPENTFSIVKLQALVEQYIPTRIKAICRTTDGWMILNGEGQRLTISPINEQAKSRFDIIFNERHNQEVINSLLSTCITLDELAD